MLPALFKKLLITSTEADLTLLRVGKASDRAAHCKYTFLGEDSLIKGEVVLAQQTNTYTNFSLTTFGSIPATSAEGVFWHEDSGEILIDFNVTFAEGEEVDSLKGTLALLDWWLKEDRGRWVACVSSSGHEVARVKGTWLRHKV
jgi:hypothetical protein